MPAIYPSLIAADQSHITMEMERLTPYCHGFHLDIMDGIFVPNTTKGADFINAIAEKARKPLWAHLMVQHPKELIERLTLQHGSIVSFHIESDSGILNLINFIKEKNYRPSIAINPKTPVTEVFPFLGSVHQVLIMSVDPGFSGQPFIHDVLDKLDPLISYRQMHKLNFSIGMDGGINPENIKEVVDRGVDDIAMGSAIFNNSDPVEFLKKLTTYIHADI